MPADAMWTLAMAINVYLAIFRNFDACHLQRLEKWYLPLCYGLPFVPAFAFCFVNDKARGRMYGNATVSDSHSLVRIHQLISLALVLGHDRLGCHTHCLFLCPSLVRFLHLHHALMRL